MVLIVKILIKNKLKACTNLKGFYSKNSKMLFSNRLIFSKCADNNTKSVFYKITRRNYQHRDIDYSKDYYGVLGVNKNATEKEIKTAYHKLARQFHPDVNGGKTTEKFKEITVAYEILSDKAKKSSYDSNQNPFSSFGNSFRNTTSSSHSTSTQQNPFSNGFGNFYSNFNNQKTDNNFHSNSYRYSGGTGGTGNGQNFYSDFANAYKNKNYKEEYHTYTYKDKDTGKYKTYTYKSTTGGKGNPFYQDFDELLKKRREQREQQKKEQEAYNNDFAQNYSNDFYFNSRKNKNPYGGEGNFNFNNFNSYDPYTHHLNQETKRIWRYVFFLCAFIFLYSYSIRRRRLHYDEQMKHYQLGGNMPYNQNYYEPIRPNEYPQYYSHNDVERNVNYFNTHPNYNNYNQSKTRDVPPYK